MKAQVNNQDRNSRAEKRLIQLILELQSVLDDYRKSGDCYEQARSSEIQSAVSALDVLTIRILNKR